MQKTAHYRYADINYSDPNTPNNQSNWSFEDHLDHCQNNYPQNDLPIFEFNDQSDCLVASHSNLNGKTKLHLVIYESGAGAAVVSKLQTPNNQQFGEYLPPNDREYIEAQVFIICSGNHILWICHNKPLRIGTMQLLFKKMFEEFLNMPLIPNVLLLAIADQTKLSSIFEDGIASIQLNLFGYKETYEYAQQNGHIAQAGFLSNLLYLMSSDSEASDAMDSMKTNISLKPGRNWAIPSIQAHLVDMATKAINEVSEDGEVTIINKKGIKIKSSSLTVQSNIEVDGNKRLLDITDTFSKLDTAYAELSDHNLLTST